MDAPEILNSSTPMSSKKSNSISGRLTLCCSLVKIPYMTLESISINSKRISKASFFDKTSPNLISKVVTVLIKKLLNTSL